MDFARAILIVLSLNSGIYQITNSGSASRYQYAKYVLDLTTKSEIFVNNLITDSVIRPKKVILFNNTEFEMRDWREAINAYLDNEC